MKNLFKLAYSAVIAVSLSFMTACTNYPEDAPENPVDNNDTPQDITVTWEVPAYSVVATHSYSKAQMIDRAIGGYSAMMSESSLTMLKAMLGYSIPENAVYHEDVIKYSSIDHKGQPVELSGIVSYKTEGNTTTTLSRIIIDCHATITDNASAPSQAGSIAQLLMLGEPTAVVSADYQGYGVSSSMIHPYLNEELTARQQIDMTKAAIDHLSDNAATSLSSRLTTYSIGYSQGGAVALATQRSLERDEPALTRAIGFTGSICGDGPYSLTNTLSAYLRQGFVSIPVILPMMVNSMKESYPSLFEGLELTDFFNEEFLNAGGGIMKHLEKKELNVIAYNALLGSTHPLTEKFPLETIFKPEALVPGSAQMKAIVGASSLNNCITGWTPSHHVSFFHSKDDTVVPYDNLDDAKQWPADVYSISQPSGEGLDHLACAMQFYSTLILKGPANMLK